MATRFRTQDTKANWARKLNSLLAPLNLTPDFREVPQTLQQWQRDLRRAQANANANGYAVSTLGNFDTKDPRDLWARSLNALAAGIEAGVARSVSISVVATDDVVSDAEAAAVTISGTSVGLADGTVISVSLDGVALTTATVTANAWSTAAQDLTAVANGAHTLTAKSSTSSTGSRPITRAD